MIKVRISEQDLEIIEHERFNHPVSHPIERVWGMLEKHWKGEILDSVEKTLGLARTMSYNAKNPVVKLIDRIYEKGAKLTKAAMEKL